MHSKQKYLRKTKGDNLFTQKKTDRRGKPKNLNKYQLQPTNSWASDQCCIRLVAFLTKKRFLNLHKTNIRIQKSGEINQYDQQQYIQQEGPKSNKQRIQLIKEITLNYFEMKDQFIGCVVLFFKSNYDVVIQQEFNDLDEHVKKVFQKLCQLLCPKFLQEFIEMLKRHKEGEQIENIAANILNEAQLSKDDNTIIQYLFLKYCNDKTEIEENKIEEYFHSWKKEYKDLIVYDLATFIKEIFQSLQACTIANN